MNKYNAMLTFYMLSIFLNASDSAGSEISQSNFEALKTYLVNHPAIECVIYKKPIIIKSSEDGSGNASTSLAYITNFAAWQKGDFLFRQVNGMLSENQTISKQEQCFVGRSGRTCWLAGPGYAVKTDLTAEESAKNPLSVAAATTNTVLPGILPLGSSMQDAVLNLGIAGVGRSAIYFTNRCFHVNLYEGTQGQDVADGEFIEKEGKVVSIKYQCKRDSGFLFVLNLTYANNNDIPPFMPSKITRKVFTSDGTFRNIADEIEFTRLTLAKSPLSSSFFLPDRFYDDKPGKLQATRELLLTNGIHYQRDGTNFVKTRQQKEPTSAMKSTARWVFGLCFALSLVFPLFLMVTRD